MKLHVLQLLQLLRHRRREAFLITGAALAILGSIMAVYATASLFATSLVMALQTQWGSPASDATPSWIMLALGLIVLAVGFGAALSVLRHSIPDSLASMDSADEAPSLESPTLETGAVALPDPAR